MWCIKTNHLACLALLLFFYPSVAQDFSASEYVTDLALAKCLDGLAKKNGWRSPAEFKSVVCHNKKIRSVQGLSIFKALEKISLHKNNVEEFDAAHFESLKDLNLGRNRLQRLKLTALTELERFYVFDNRLSELELDDLPKLKLLKANSNKLKRFTYQKLPVLEKVYLFDNEMEHIDIYSLPAMTYMDVRQNPMPDKLYEQMDKLSGLTILHDGNADDWN